MPGILVTLSTEGLQRVKAAANAAGMTDRGWCRCALLNAASNPGPSPGVSTLSAEADAAMLALIDLGVPEATAKARCQMIAREQPKLDAAGLIAAALRRAEP